jgi:hypothetical protein
MNLFNKKTFTLLVFALGFISLTACQNTQLASKEASSAAGDSITTDSIAAAQSTADAANIRANEAFQAAQTARRVAERGVEMANQNQAALRALNDKIDRMFETISRK